MSRSPIAHRVMRLLAIVVPTVPFVLGADILSLADAAKPAKDDTTPDAHRVNGQGLATLCEPILGRGKTTGVPIKVEDASGTWLTDISGLTFELTDGTTTQDVTSYIKTPEQEQLVTGQTLTDYGSLNDAGIGSAFRSLGVNTSSTGPTLDLSNTGFFFLDCTPLATKSEETFPAGTVLQAKSGGTVISSGSVEGRSANRLVEFASTDNNGPTMTAITPSGASNTDLAQTYSDYLTLTGIRFRPAFAAMAIMELSNSTSGSDTTTITCWDDLTNVSGSTWTWTTAGQDFIDELTSSSATTWPILTARTKGLAGPTLGGTNPCDSTLSTSDDDFFLNMLGAQLLLIDGPRGNVPTSISNSVAALRPAVVLKKVTPTSDSSSTTTSTSTSLPTSISTSTSIPSTTSSTPKKKKKPKTTTTMAHPSITIVNKGRWSTTSTSTTSTTTSTTSTTSTTTTVPASGGATGEGGLLPPIDFRPLPLTLTSFAVMSLGLYLVGYSRRRPVGD